MRNPTAAVRTQSGLLMWEEGKHASAAWEWHFSFTSHWGTHAVDALRQIQGWINEHVRGSRTQESCD